MAELPEVMAALLAEIKGLKDEMKGLKETVAKGEPKWDPEKLKASTATPEKLPPLKEVKPKDPAKPNLVPPVPRD